ncbi:rubrerythrin [Dyadobacter sp. BE34]|uniref:Rubrerythrin n=1 Tax=Dyadobacter fermentans TaxID=94254 RepID=A0ABU1QZW6_9BACT|nr:MULTISPECIES: ferritin-like protein [Dyadobacter]MDR6806699.1 rubrerythrin [Dyadobacter fermentans]MDR7044441.1 rubrerythrin [Dyadobacter sp. BE242]MDR7198751.1 rubrerythrin [Dyadobacter sp. BE34]MDR7216713.1 rubrerythrin [Dyadobacter sp. BE31]MDR7263761.1 rubrerythrin [Dyadobacter sp. BE32]
MLQIDSRYIEKALSANALEELYPLVQNAVELEHSTIPPYLTAMFSLNPGANPVQRQVIHSIVIEEMLHMTIAANILNALGGHPVINHADFVPEYPGPLPMGIGNGLIVGLEKYSTDVVKNVFMEIEEPENPLVFKSVSLAALPTYSTIGQFYQAIQQKIDELAPDELPGEKSKQVTSSFFPADELFPIYTKQNAIDAINIIIEQGEGTSTSPLDQEDELAHYYRFEELYKGKRLVKDDTAPNGYSFSGPAIPFSAEGVFPLFPNTKISMLPVGSEEWNRMNEFNTSYYSLLSGLHTTFNGQPGMLDNTVGVMYDLKLTAQKLCATPFPGKPGYTIGPSFEFIVPAGS